MPMRLRRDEGQLFRLDLQGTLRRDEFLQCQRALAREMDGGATVRLLVILDRFEGWDSRDNWSDLTFYAKYSDCIERIAIVGDERWRSEALMFAGADLRRAPVEYFEGSSSDDGAARAWLTA